MQGAVRDYNDISYTSQNIEKITENDRHKLEKY